MSTTMRKSRKIRVKAAEGLSSFFRDGDCMTRNQAITRIRESISFSRSLSQEARRLIGLFSIDPEELAEAGLCYETLKLLERQALFI